MWKIRLCVVVFWIVFVLGLLYLDVHLDSLLGIHRTYSAYPAGHVVAGCAEGSESLNFGQKEDMRVPAIQG